MQGRIPCSIKFKESQYLCHEYGGWSTSSILKAPYLMVQPHLPQASEQEVLVLLEGWQ